MSQQGLEDSFERCKRTLGEFEQFEETVYSRMSYDTVVVAVLRLRFEKGDAYCRIYFEKKGFSWKIDGLDIMTARSAA